MTHSKTVRSIRNRLFLLLLRAFAIVIVFLMLFTLLVTAFVLSNPTPANPLYSLPIIARLESYYLAHGDWEGVTVVFTSSHDIEAMQWHSGLLLDGQDRIVVDHGRPVAPPEQQIYTLIGNERVAPIEVDGVVVGKFIPLGNAPPPERRYTFGFLQPILMVSIILAVFAALIGMLLTRRVVSPLAEVIAAAEDIAGGNLQTRVRSQGPDDLRDLSDSFNQMADSLERNDRERREMLADIAHELRTPLTVMRGRLEGILDGVYPADKSQVIPALEETYLLERLVEDLRLLTLAESRQLPFEKCELDLADIAQRCINMFQPEADEKKVQLSLDTPLDKTLVLADALRIEQCIGNLLSNALLYVFEGGRVWIEINQLEDELALSVNDNGPGLPQADLPFIFNRFWRGEKSRARITGGAGLGLAITKLLVEGQGGRIEARNLQAGGLQVCIYFKVDHVRSKRIVPDGKKG